MPNTNLSAHLPKNEDYFFYGIWKVNLISVWFRCFFTGLAISQILPFLPLYVSQLGVTSHEALSMWSGLTFSVTFLVSAIVSPMWEPGGSKKGATDAAALRGNGI